MSREGREEKGQGGIARGGRGGERSRCGKGEGGVKEFKEKSEGREIKGRGGRRGRGQRGSGRGNVGCVDAGRRGDRAPSSWPLRAYHQDIVSQTMALSASFSHQSD